MSKCICHSCPKYFRRVFPTVVWVALFLKHVTIMSINLRSKLMHLNNSFIWREFIYSDSISSLQLLGSLFHFLLPSLTVFFVCHHTLCSNILICVMRGLKSGRTSTESSQWFRAEKRTSPGWALYFFLNSHMIEMILKSGMQDETRVLCNCTLA